MLSQLPVLLTNGAFLGARCFQLKDYIERNQAMDERPMRNQGHAGGNTGGGATTLDQGRTMEQAKTTAAQAMEQVKTTANQAMEQAKTTAGEAMEQAKTMARNIGDQAAAAAADPGATAQELARRAREQANVAGDVLYRQGQRAGEYLTQNVNEYPLTALLIAGMIGYGMAYLIHSQWQSQDSWRD
jgi:ElaB/YqjD/DUF883 family membrane-anchored ribosome-binding protein